MKKITESQLRQIVKESVNNVLNEKPYDEIENVPTYDIFTENISLTELDTILSSKLYDKNENCVGRLSDLHFKYDTETNRFY